MAEPKAVQDSGWAPDARASAGTAVVLTSLLLGVDAAAGFTDWPRTAVWAGLGAVLFVVLWPTRVSAAPGRLTTRGLVRRRRVRTDRLASVVWHDGLAQRLVLTDTDGNRVELDPRVLTANPPLWHRVGQDIDTSVARGTLAEGVAPMRRLSRLIDSETAQAVFRVSALS
ncbi:hypothetical protein EF903_10185 [Streptomyces sp. WAC05292]|uniref:hypothetical protein n=1 Tax=Streptomyces sp. WAC05292 TaxID=2487418 RepID=UPI000F73C727|nr:hypothetical protein [Streptomyces sp. WAC05292]RSS92029.1 hypothetical protein EF903_10185 [Streptomyces sp. WAC05292]